MSTNALGRIPSIEPISRSLLKSGFPNEGKSSFIIKFSRTEDEVQPYAFTSKCLYAGHFDYNIWIGKWSICREY